MQFSESILLFSTFVPKLGLRVQKRKYFELNFDEPSLKVQLNPHHNEISLKIQALQLSQRKRYNEQTKDGYEIGYVGSGFHRKYTAIIPM